MCTEGFKKPWSSSFRCWQHKSLFWKYFFSLLLSIPRSSLVLHFSVGILVIVTLIWFKVDIKWRKKLEQNSYSLYQCTKKKEGWSWTKYFLLDQNNFYFSSFQLPFSAPGVLSCAAPNQCLLYIQHYLSVPLPGFFPVSFVSLPEWAGGSGPREPTVLSQDSCRAPHGPDMVQWRGTGGDRELRGPIFFFPVKGK